ncbi:hypothetical protein BKA66DRAFT_606504 [Pyrenochaeta sp. MPI-SDFR-AT-0127]|nr:hypothetical protein BKA66DRAFT_606504 [Pyrenochaeta sp. MPI-SDFR-AT-0127]
MQYLHIFEIITQIFDSLISNQIHTTFTMKFTIFAVATLLPFFALAAPLPGADATPADVGGDDLGGTLDESYVLERRVAEADAGGDDLGGTLDESYALRARDANADAAGDELGGTVDESYVEKRDADADDDLGGTVDESYVEKRAAEADAAEDDLGGTVDDTYVEE